jgi:hypothetical protein
VVVGRGEDLAPPVLLDVQLGVAVAVRASQRAGLQEDRQPIALREPLVERLATGPLVAVPVGLVRARLNLARLGRDVRLEPLADLVSPVSPPVVGSRSLSSRPWSTSPYAGPKG